MNVTQKISLIEKIARELDARYDYTDIDTFLVAYQLEISDENHGTKFNYAKQSIRNASVKSLGDMAEELNISFSTGLNASVRPPKCWQDTKKFRLFISHLALEKEKAHRLKASLEKYNILSFVAHDDIEPTKPWQEEIERGLSSMDAMLAILTKKFSESVWTQQEIGFALGRGIKVLSLRMEEDPKGFISKEQAILRRNRTAEQIAEEVNTILLNDSKTKSRMASVLAAHVADDDDDVPF